MYDYKTDGTIWRGGEGGGRDCGGICGDVGGGWGSVGDIRW